MMPQPSSKMTRPKPEGSTRMGTQGTILAGVDMRSHGGRRFKELCADLVDHLGDDPTAPQLAIIRRAAALSVWCELAEAGQAQGKELNIAEYATATNTLRRLMVDLGLDRGARDVTPPTLDEYLNAKAQADE